MEFIGQNRREIDEFEISKLHQVEVQDRINIAEQQHRGGRFT